MQTNYVLLRFKYKKLNWLLYFLFKLTLIKENIYILLD